MTIDAAQHKFGTAATALRDAMKLTTPDQRAAGYVAAVEPLKEVAKANHLGPISGLAQASHQQVTTGANLLAGPNVNGLDMMKSIIGKLVNAAGTAVAESAKVIKST